MRRRYVFLAGSLALMLTVVLLCLFMPGALLKLENQQIVGEIMQADQVYYADNVTAEDTISFDITMRLMMLEDRWKSKKTSTDITKIQGNILDMSEARDFCTDTMLFFTWEMWTQLPQMMDINLPAYAGVLSEEQDYLQAAVDGEMPGDIQSVIEGGEMQLYAYEETVLNSYYFYVWEYTAVDEALGIDLHMVLDAVTMDVYSISIGGELFGGLAWAECMNYYLIAAPVPAMQSIQMMSAMEVTLTSFDPVWLPLAWLCNYYLVTMGDESIMSGQSYSEKWYSRDVMSLGTDENGYTFWGGNFIVYKDLIFTAGYNDKSLCLSNQDESTVYASLNLLNGAFEWKLTSYVPLTS